MTRADRRRQTRDVLVETARAVFARDGYHGARLDEIAREAGYSKGAVYSNFTGKADLFLAVVDTHITLVDHTPWDPFDSSRSSGPSSSQDGTDRAVEDGRLTGIETEEAIRGFGLATLEFIASAAREPELAQQMATRMERMVDQYAASTVSTVDPELDDHDRALLQVALEQGAALLALSGVTRLDQRLLRVGLRRVLDPRRAAENPVADVRGGSGIHHQEYRDAVRKALIDDA